MSQREAMIVTCRRCEGSYDMDTEEDWDDHHPAPDGSPCDPADGCVIVTDRIGDYCMADHTGDWFVDTVTVDDEDELDQAAAVDERPAALPG